MVILQYNTSLSSKVVVLKYAPQEYIQITLSNRLETE